MRFTVNDEAAFSDDPALLQALGNGIAGVLGVNAGTVTVMLELGGGARGSLSGRRLLIGTVVADFAIDSREADASALQDQLNGMDVDVLAGALNGALAAAGLQARISAVTAVTFQGELSGQQPHLQGFARIVQEAAFWFLTMVVFSSMAIWGWKLYTCGVRDGRLADAWKYSRLIPHQLSGDCGEDEGCKGHYHETAQDSDGFTSSHADSQGRQRAESDSQHTTLADLSRGLAPEDDSSDGGADMGRSTTFADARYNSYRGGKRKKKTVDQENLRKSSTTEMNRDVRLKPADGDWLVAEVVVLMCMPFVGCLSRLLASLILGPAVIFLFFLVFCAPLIVRAKTAEDFLSRGVRQHGACDSCNREDWTRWRYWASCLIWTNGAWYGLSLGDALYWDDKVVQDHFVTSWRATGSVPAVMWCVENLHVWGLMLIFLLAKTVTCLGYACSNIVGKPTVVAQIAGFDDLVACMRAGVQKYELLREDADRVVAVGISRIFFEGLPGMYLQTSLVMAHGQGLLAMPTTLTSVLVSLASIVLTVWEMIRLVLDQTPPSPTSAERGLPNWIKGILGAIAMASVAGLCVIVVRLLETEVCPDHSWGFSVGCVNFHATT